MVIGRNQVDTFENQTSYRLRITKFSFSKFWFGAVCFLGGASLFVYLSKAMPKGDIFSPLVVGFVCSLLMFFGLKLILQAVSNK